MAAAVIPPLLDVVTVDDLLRAGACREGVLAARDALVPGRTAVPVADLLRQPLDDEGREYLLRACGRAGGGEGSGGGRDPDLGGGRGYGDGYGRGYGGGSGSGEGEGYGDGDGYGYG